MRGRSVTTAPPSTARPARTSPWKNWSSLAKTCRWSNRPMSPSLTYNGRLPGVVCQAALPPPPEDPLRLDVAGFVGFAERGPLDTPVLLEDAAQYRRVFGGDLPVAREGGRPIYAYLPGAVQAFFDNGGG